MFNKDRAMIEYSKFDHVFRRLVPSMAKISYNPVVKAAGDTFASLFSWPFFELRDLPPNHLRIRIGVGNRVLANQVYFLQVGCRIWLSFLSHQYCSFNSDVVELGCGCGRSAWPLKEDWFEGTFVGVDIDSEMIEYCQQNFPRERFRFVLSPHKSETYASGRSEAASSDRLVIADAESKDFVYSISLYSHLLETEVREYLSETFRILRRGGLMHLTFFCLEHIQIGRRWTFRHRQGNAYIENDKFPEAAVAYHEATMIELAEKAGFREISVIPQGVQAQSVLIARK